MKRFGVLLAICVMSGLNAEAATVTTLTAGNFGIGFVYDDIRPIHEIRIVPPPGLADGMYSIQAQVTRSGSWFSNKTITFGVTGGEVAWVSPKQLLGGDVYGNSQDGAMVANASSLVGCNAGGAIADRHVIRQAGSAQEFWNAWGQGTKEVYEPFYIYLYRPSDPQAVRVYDEKAFCESGGIGMPQCNVHVLAVSLNITDSPLTYRTAVGEPMVFTLVYNQREKGGPDLGAQTNFGALWSCNWTSWVVDDPSLPGASPEVRLANGGAESFQPLGNGQFAPHPQSGAKLSKIATGYERRLADGSRELFELCDGATAFPRKHFLTQRIDRAGHGFTLEYEREGGPRLKRIVDPLGAITTLEYGAAGAPMKPTRVLDPFGRSAQFQYDQQQHLVGIVDQVGMTSRLSYDQRQPDLVRAVTTPYGTTTFAVGENGNNRWVEITDPMGGRKRVEFRDRAPGAPGAEGFAPSGYAAANKQLDYNNTYIWDCLAMEQAPGDYSKARVIHWLNNGEGVAGLPASRKDPLEGRIWYSYEGQTDPLKVGASSRVTAVARLLDNGSTQLSRFEYDSEGNLLKTVDPLGRIQLFNYTQGNLTRISEWSGGGVQTVRSFEYDAAGLLLRRIEANGATTSWTYNDLGLPLSVTNALGSAIELNYCSEPSRRGLLNEIRAAGNVLAKYTYDPFRRVSSWSNAEGYTVRFSYEAVDGLASKGLNRLTRVDYPDGSFEAFTYDRLDPDSFRSRAGNVSRFRYNARRQLQEQTDPLGARTKFQWCACGSLDAMVDPAGNPTSWAYDLQGRLRSRSTAGQLMATYEYEPLSGRLRSVTDAMGQTVQYGYCLDDALESVTYVNALRPTASVGFSYDAENGRLRTMRDASGITSYSYYPLSVPGAGALACVEGPLGRIDYEYDLLGRPSKRGIAGIQQSVSYDALGRVARTESPLGEVSFAYLGASSKPLRAVFGQGLIVDWSYESLPLDPWLKGINCFRFGQASFLRVNYRRDPAGRISAATEEGGRKTTGFGYDAVGQLVNAVSQGASALNWSYAYDSVGNRVSTQRQTAIATAHYNSLNQIEEIVCGSGQVRFAGWVTQNASVTVNGLAAATRGSRFEAMVPMSTGTHEVTIAATGSSGISKSQKYQVVVSGSGKRSCTYDLNGNMVSNGENQSYEWDAANRLLAINYPGTDRRTEFAYDGLGRRIKIIEKEGAKQTQTDSIWDGLTLLEQRHGTRRTTEFSEGFWDSEGDRGSAYYTLRDHLGSVRVILDSNGVVCARYSYDPFGQRMATESSLETDFGFTGHRYHAASGLHLAPFRVYDSNLGRWLSRDPLGEGSGMNSYAYVGNDPVNFLDPLGLMDFFANARVTAFAYGTDNAYAGHPDGSDHVALAIDRLRIDAQGDSHAVLGDGSLAFPSSLAVNPKSGIRLGSKVYIEGIGWFVVEDVCAKRLPTDTFDMWTGRQVDSILRALTGPRNVSVFGPNETIPRNYLNKGAGLLWSFMPAGNTRVGERVR